MPSFVYRRHEPEKSLLYETVRENLETFLEHCRTRASGADLPRYVVGAFRRFLKCGILQHGFARVRCAGCGYDQLVAFSCKERSLCPSCSARRMSEMAAHLVDKVFPVAPVRQWVLSLPFAIRFIFARDAKLLSRGLRIFASEVFRQLKLSSGLRKALPGGVTAVQRFGGALNLNVHFHSIMLDGVFVRGKGKPEFRKVDPPGEDELEEVVERTASRILEMLREKGFEVGESGEVEETDTGQEELFDAMKGASVRGLVGVGGRARRVPLLNRRPGGWPIRVPGRWSAMTRSGFSLHAGVRITGGDREGLEKLCRYGLRPPLSGERLERLPDGRILYGFRKARADGSTHVVLEPLELLEKLAALVPPPRAHLLVYHGVLGPRSRHRKDVVPAPEEPACAHEEERPRRSGGRGRKRMPWAELLKRTFGIDALECPRCRGRMSVIACIDEPEAIRKILKAKRLPLEAPRAAPARPPPGEPGFESDQGDMDEASV